MKSLFTVLKTDTFHEELRLLARTAKGYNNLPPTHTHTKP